ncbi:hypothetical protein Dimus_013512 [Dionaea muscipula]
MDVGHNGPGGSAVIAGGSGERVFLGDGDRGSVRGLASEGVGRSYASAVGPDLRSDVRLHFVPSVMPADDEEVCTLDSDRDETEWGVCLMPGVRLLFNEDGPADADGLRFSCWLQAA